MKDGERERKGAGKIENHSQPIQRRWWDERKNVVPSLSFDAKKGNPQ